MSNTVEGQHSEKGATPGYLCNAWLKWLNHYFLCNERFCCNSQTSPKRTRISRGLVLADLENLLNHLANLQTHQLHLVQLVVKLVEILILRHCWKVHSLSSPKTNPASMKIYTVIFLFVIFSLNQNPNCKYAQI